MIMLKKFVEIALMFFIVFKNIKNMNFIVKKERLRN